MDAFASLRKILAGSDIPYALIGAYAVNVWLEPRYTADVDLVVQVGGQGAELDGLINQFINGGFTISAEDVTDNPSGPDFLKFESMEGGLVIDIQLVKTGYQQQVIEEAKEVDGFRIARAEDLIILKLIANRPKDRIDLEGLARLPDIEWPYVEKWATEWEVTDLLASLRETES